MAPHKQRTAAPLDEYEARQRFGHASMWSEDEPVTRFAMGTQELDPLRMLQPARDADVTDTWQRSSEDVESEVAPAPAPDGLRADDVAQLVHDFKNPLGTIALELC